MNLQQTFKKKNTSNREIIWHPKNGFKCKCQKGWDMFMGRNKMSMYEWLSRFRQKKNGAPLEDVGQRDHAIFSLDFYYTGIKAAV